jgi:sulfoxide reductase heme-binding subunit YedZ
MRKLIRKLFLQRATEDMPPNTRGSSGTSRWEKVFGTRYIGIITVLLFVGSLLFKLFFEGSEQGHGGEQSFFLTGPTLLVLTSGYLMLLAVWADLRRNRIFLLRHVASAAAMWFLVVLYLNAFGGFQFNIHSWNRSFANASVVLYAVTLAIGPLARLWRAASQALAWRREAGIWATIAAVVHIGIFWEGAYGWAGWRSFFYPGRGEADTLIGGGAINIANVVGLVALVYALVLAITSNDASQRLLKSGWSWIQKRATTMWFLVLLHTWLFAYYIEGFALTINTLWISFWMVLLLQTAAFIKTIWFRGQKH